MIATFDGSKSLGTLSLPVGMAVVMFLQKKSTMLYQLE